jgi:hypothetical protein
MDVRRSLVVILALLVPATAYASGHNFDVAFGGSLLALDSSSETAPTGAARQGIASASVTGPSDTHDKLHVLGWQVVAAHTLHNHRKWAIVGDMSGNFWVLDKPTSPQGKSASQQDKPELQQITFMFGPRYESSAKRGTFLFHALPFGFRFDNQDSRTMTLAAALGGSFEWKVKSYEKSGMAFRAGYDRLLLYRAKAQNRFSLTALFRYHE